MARGPFDDVQAALKLASRVLSAAEPLASLGKPDPRPRPDKGEAREAVRRARPAACATCGGSGRVGAKGHEATCPSCEGIIEAESYCATCAGTGLVGRKGHEVDCPVCS